MIKLNLNKNLKIFYALLQIILISGCKNSDKVSYKYYDNVLPKDSAIVFSPGNISNGFHEHGITISPDFEEMFYVLADNSYKHYIIIRIKRIGKYWSDPEIAPFSGEFKDHAVAFSYNGENIFYSTNRDISNKTQDNLDIWSISKENKEWSVSLKSEEIINSKFDEVNPSVAENGNLYFQSNREDNWDIYMSKFENGKYTKPTKLDTLINTEHSECGPFIAADESFLLFHSNRKDSFGGMDIFISVKKDDKWQKPINLGEKVNSLYSEFKPFISPDGKYLFFSSYRKKNISEFKTNSYNNLMEELKSPNNGYATLYWIETSFLNEFIK